MKKIVNGFLLLTKQAKEKMYTLPSFLSIFLIISYFSFLEIITKPLYFYYAKVINKQDFVHISGLMHASFHDKKQEVIR